MNDETLQRANEIKARLKQIEKEKDFLIEFMPPVKEVCREKEGRYGRFFSAISCKDRRRKEKVDKFNRDKLPKLLRSHKRRYTRYV